MTCNDAREWFTDWVDEALTAEERALLDAHLAQCADCRKELERFGGTVALLRRVERPRAPVGFVDRVLEAARPAPWHRRLLQRLFLPLSVKLPAEAAVVLLVAGLAVYVFQRTPELQQAARKEAFQTGARSEAPAVPASPPTPPAARERLAAKLTDRPSKPPAQADKSEEQVASEDTRRSASQEASNASPPPAPPGPAAPPSSAEPKLEFSKEMAARGGPAPSRPSEPAASPSRPAPAEEGGKNAAPASATSVEPKLEFKSGAEPHGLVAPGAAQTAPSASPRAPATERRADSERDKTASPPPVAAPPPSAMRVLRSADVVGRLAVKDRDAAERALGEVLARSGGVVISRREDAGTTVVEVAVPKTAYPRFTQGLAGIGAWVPEGQPSELPPDVRVTLRLVQ